MDDKVFNLLWDDFEAHRDISITQRLNYSRWYRSVVAVLRFAYGWLGYKGPPSEVRTVLPNMKIVSIERTPETIRIEARMVNPDTRWH